MLRGGTQLIRGCLHRCALSQLQLRRSTQQHLSLSLMATIPRPSNPSTANIVTYQGFRLSQATPTDAVVLSDIASRTFVDTFGHLYPPEELEAYLRQAYNVPQMQSELSDPMKYTVLLFADEAPKQPCGYIMLHDGSVRTGDVDGRPEDYLEIKRVYVDKPFHGRGAAQVMMAHIMDIIRAKPRKTVWLGVWEQNHRAQRFYQKYGFVEKGEHIFNVGQCKDRDVLFELQQCSHEMQ